MGCCNHVPREMLKLAHASTAYGFGYFLLFGNCSVGSLQFPWILGFQILNLYCLHMIYIYIDISLIHWVY